MKKQNDGFILALTLGIILVLGLLLLTCMQHVLVYHKAINEQLLRHHNFYQLERSLMKLAQTKFNKEPCLMRGATANHVMNQLIKGAGCSLVMQRHKYRYIIEDLGEFPCLAVLHHNKKYATQHFRITLMLFAAEHQTTNSLLQVRYIEAGALSDCQGEEHLIHTGINSWRYLIKDKEQDELS